MSMGVLRRVDKMGRVVIPKEFRDVLGMENDVDRFEVILSGDQIILRKFQPACIFCDNFAEMVDLNGKPVCLKCVEKLNMKVVEKAASGRI